MVCFDPKRFCIPAPSPQTYRKLMKIYIYKTVNTQLLSYRSPEVLLGWLLGSIDINFHFSFPCFAQEGAHPHPYPPPWTTLVAR